MNQLLELAREAAPTVDARLWPQPIVIEESAMGSDIVRASYSEIETFAAGPLSGPARDSDDGRLKASRRDFSAGSSICEPAACATQVTLPAYAHCNGPITGNSGSYSGTFSATDRLTTSATKTLTVTWSY